MKNFLLLVTATLILAGCKVKLEQEYTFTSDTTFDAIIVIAADEEIRETMEEDGVPFDASDITEQFRDETEIGDATEVRVEEYSDTDGFEGERLHVSDVSLSAINRYDNPIFAETSTPGVWELVFDFNGKEDDTEFDPAGIMELSLIVRNVEIIETNGKVDGSTVKWGNEMTETPPVLTFRPTGQTDSDNNLNLMLLAGVGILFFVGGAGYAATRKNVPSEEQSENEPFDADTVEIHNVLES